MIKIYGLIAKLKGCRNKDFLTDKSKLLSLLKKAAELMGSTVFSEHAYEFEPQGISAVVIVGESHLAIHSWPEFDSAYLVVTVCKNGDLKKGVEFIERELGAEETEVKFLTV